MEGSSPRPQRRGAAGGAGTAGEAGAGGVIGGLGSPGASSFYLHYIQYWFMCPKSIQYVFCGSFGVLSQLSRDFMSVLFA